MSRDQDERGRRAQEEVLSQKVKNLEDQHTHGLAALEQRVTRLENSPGASGAAKLAEIEERITNLEGGAGSGGEMIDLVTHDDLDQFRKDSDKNYVAGPAYKELKGMIADLESRVAKIEKAAAKPAKEPKESPATTDQGKTPSS